MNYFDSYDDILNLKSKARNGRRLTQPVITFETKEIDYGIIKKKSDGHREFTYTNNGTEPLIILEVTTSCGCTAVKWDKSPLISGKRNAIRINYNTSHIGPFRKTILVQSNDPDAGKTILYIKGEVKP